MPEPTLQTAALRYAAGDLTADEAAAFEVRLGTDQEARDALAEAVRLSAAALGQHSPAPHSSFRAAIREQLTGWTWPGFARRAYRGHPLAWAGIGATVVAACTVIGLVLANREVAPARAPVPHARHPLQESDPERPPAPLALNGALNDESDPSAVCNGESNGNSVAEIWAHLSTPDHVEKLHDLELRWRDKLRSLGIHPAARAESKDH